jgi:hypothetical protein
MSETNRIVLSVDRCSRHRNMLAICLQQGCTGRRLTASKCCGLWVVMKQWTLTADEAREIAGQLLAAASAVPNGAPGETGAA